MLRAIRLTEQQLSTVLSALLSRELHCRADVVLWSQDSDGQAVEQLYFLSILPPRRERPDLSVSTVRVSDTVQTAIRRLMVSPNEN